MDGLFVLEGAPQLSLLHVHWQGTYARVWTSIRRVKRFSKSHQRCRMSIMFGRTHAGDFLSILSSLLMVFHLAGLFVSLHHVLFSILSVDQNRA